MARESKPRRVLCQYREMRAPVTCVPEAIAASVILNLANIYRIPYQAIRNISNSVL